MEGLGRSPTARYYSIHSRQEADAYLRHPILGARLRECTGLVMAITGKSAHQIFGYPDDMKFRSSMALFDAIGDEGLFGDALQKFYRGEKDQATLSILRDWDRA